MRYSHISALAFLLAFTQIQTTAPLLTRLEKLDTLALRPSSDRDERSITKNGSLENRDMNQDCNKNSLAVIGPPKRRANSYNHPRSLSRFESGFRLPVYERSLLTDITTTGFSLVWGYLDIIYASYIAYHQTTNFWANVTANARGKWKAERSLMTLDICYGSLRLSIAALCDVISWELVAEFAAQMTWMRQRVYHQHIVKR